MLDEYQKMVFDTSIPNSKVERRLREIIEDKEDNDPLVTEAFFITEKKRFDVSLKVWAERFELRREDNFRSSLETLKRAAKDPTVSNEQIVQLFWNVIALGVKDIEEFAQVWLVLEERPVISLHIAAQAFVLSEFFQRLAR